MKKTSFIHRAVTAPVLSAAALLLTATTQNSKAGITVEFEETGGNVVATISGSIDLSGLTLGINDNLGSRGSASYTTERFLQIGTAADGGTFDRYSGGVVTNSGLSLLEAPDTVAHTVTHTVTEAFGYVAGQLYVPGEIADNSPAYTPTPGMTVTFTSITPGESTSLADIGLGGLSATPLAVWNNPNATGDAGSIQFVRPVPELPSITSTSLESGTGDFLVTFSPGSANYVLKSSNDLTSPFVEVPSAVLENGNSTFRVPAADLNPSRDFFVIELAR